MLLFESVAVVACSFVCSLVLVHLAVFVWFCLFVCFCLFVYSLFAVCLFSVVFASRCLAAPFACLFLVSCFVCLCVC